MKKLLKKIIRKYHQRIRISYFSVLHDRNINILGTPNLVQPVIFKGKGKIKFEGKVQIGYDPSPGIYSETAYIEARESNATIIIKDGVYINNSCKIIAQFGNIIIEEECLIGYNVTIMNSDFHNLDIDKRKTGMPLYDDIKIERNVFIGSNVIINKGVKIGENSIIGSGSVVIDEIPSNSIAAGIPAKVLKKLNI